LVVADEQHIGNRDQKKNEKYIGEALMAVPRTLLNEVTGKCGS
jgi:hypothetical protein